MAGGVIDGTPVDAANTNPKFIYKDFADTSSGVLSLNNSSGPQGSTVTSLQKEHNSASSFMGKALNAVYNALPSFINNQGFTMVQSLFDAIDAMRALFNNASGHKHDGTLGGGAQIPASSIGSVPNLGYIQQGTIYTAVGTSNVVTSLLTGKSPSSSSAVTGVVVNAPYNKVVLRYASGINTGDLILDSLGNEVYGRITYSATVWTITYYVDLSGTETSYSMPSTSIIWYYQELYNPLYNPPTYSTAFFIPSDNATADVLDASATQRGVVNTTTQTFAGVKTFNSSPILNSLTASQPLTLDGSKNIVNRITNANTASIGNGVQFKDIVFGTAFASTSYDINFSFTNVTDTDPIFLIGIITTKSTTGFTVTFNAPTDSSNYLLEYEAATYV